MGEEENDGILNLADIKRQKRLFFQPGVSHQGLRFFSPRKTERRNSVKWAEQYEIITLSK